LIVVVAMFPLPVMPIVLAIQKRRRREAVTQVDRARSTGSTSRNETRLRAER
jgi:hypothetical protein